MKQEEKEFLLKDLCARLPYGVKVLNISEVVNEVCEVDSILTSRKYKDKIFVFLTVPNDSIMAGIEMVKPYLRPMSSMTKDEKEELVDFGLAYWDNGKYTDEDGNTIIYGGKNFQLLPDIETYDWLNKNHFDYRGLIPKGLAIEVTEENNPYASN